MIFWLRYLAPAVPNTLRSGGYWLAPIRRLRCRQGGNDGATLFGTCGAKYAPPRRLLACANTPPFAPIGIRQYGAIFMWHARQSKIGARMLASCQRQREHSEPTRAVLSDSEIGEPTRAVLSDSEIGEPQKIKKNYYAT